MELKSFGVRLLSRQQPGQYQTLRISLMAIALETGKTKKDGAGHLSRKATRWSIKKRLNTGWALEGEQKGKEEARGGAEKERRGKADKR